MKTNSAPGTGPYHIHAEINMIPLIDVSLVLLIIFMVMSPILVESQLRVNLPQVATGGKAEQTALKVEIAGNGNLAFKGRRVSREELKLALQKELPPGHKASLLIQADKDVAFDSVVYVMDIAKQLRVEKLGVAVRPEFGVE